METMSHIRMVVNWAEEDTRILGHLGLGRRSYKPTRRLLVEVSSHTQKHTRARTHTHLR